MKLAAIAAFALVGLAVAQTVHSIPTKEVRLVGEIPAEWWTFVEVENVNGTPTRTYTVPPRHTLVVTRSNYSYYLQANGQPVYQMLEAVETCCGGIGVNSTGGTRVTFAEGTVLELSFPSSLVARLWGYLEPVR